MFRVLSGYLTVSFRTVYNERNGGRKAFRNRRREKGDTSLAGGKKIPGLLARLAGSLVAVALLALLSVALILAKPQENTEKAPAETPSAQGSPAVVIEAESDLYQLISSYPAPVMSFMSGSGMTFVSASSADAAVSGGFGRVATLCWQTPEGEPVTLRTIWPADALSLLEDGYHFMPYAGPSLFGNASVRMENDSAIRLHTDTDLALYAVYLPRSLGGQVSDLCRSLQLFTVSQ